MNDLESRLRAALHDETAELAARPELADDMVTRGTKVRRRRRVAGGAAGLVVLAALVPVWRSVDTSSGPTPPAKLTPTIVTQSPPTDPPPTKTPVVWSTKAVVKTHSPAQIPLVTALRVGEHKTYDRVVIDFSGPMSSYRIKFVPRLTEDASGAPVHLRGRALLSIVLQGADAHTEGGTTVYLPTGEKHDYSFTTLRATAVTGDNGAVVSVGLGLSRKAGLRVIELPSPTPGDAGTRLVIDLQH